MEEVVGLRLAVGGFTLATAESCTGGLVAHRLTEVPGSSTYFMEGAEVLPNPNGSAPGMYLEHEGRVVVLLPGPPREMKPMFEGLVMPRIAERAGGLRVVRRVLRVAGLGESAVDERIAPVYTQYKNPQTTILFNS